MNFTIRDRKLFYGILLITFLFFSIIGTSLAATSSDDLNKPIKNADDMLGLTQALLQLGVGLCVLAAAIYIAIGSFYYFAASGNAKFAEEGKQIITRSILGLVIALISWVILNTIHPQFAEELKNPKFGNGQSK
ncbi:MAG: hypothetical protein Q7S57_01100 [bacterium]|nr:hypothetical protein [bacterium]